MDSAGQYHYQRINCRVQPCISCPDCEDEMSDPLGRKTVKCEACDGQGKPPNFDPIYDSYDLVCGACNGDGQRFETDSEYIARLEKLCEWLAKDAIEWFHMDPFTGETFATETEIQARLEAAEKAVEK